MSSLKRPLKILATYDRGRDEPTHMFAEFQVYLEFGPERSLQQVSERVNKPLSTIRDHARRWCWRDRAGSWDQHVSKKRRLALEESAVKDARRQRQLVSRLETLALNEATKLCVLSKNSDDPIGQANTVIKAIEAAVKLRRLISGESTENLTAVHANERMDLSLLTDEELAMADSLVNKAAGRLPALPPGPVKQ